MNTDTSRTISGLTNVLSSSSFNSLQHFHKGKRLSDYVGIEVKLTTPPGKSCLEHFAGSGTTVSCPMA